MRGAARFVPFLEKAAVVIVFAWAVRSLVVTGDAVLNERLLTQVRTDPSLTPLQAGDIFARSMVKLGRTIPSRDHVLVVWSDVPDYYYAFFWSTYWLFPRHVVVATSLDPNALAQADTVVSVQRPGQPSPVPAGFASHSIDSYPDLIVVTFVRAHA